MVLKNYISGKIYDCELCSPLENVAVTLKDLNGRVLSRTMSDKSGIWQMPGYRTGFILSFKKEGFFSKSIKDLESTNIIRLMESRLIGYHNTLACNPGSAIDCFVNSPAPFSAKLYRHGLEKLLILDLEKFPAEIQSCPDCYFVENGVGWKKTFSYIIPENAKPGIYSLLLESKGHQSFAIPLHVSTPQKSWGSRNILVLSSTNNWQTYNLWGGRSRYRNYENWNSPGFIDKTSLMSTINRNLAKILNDKQVEFLKRLIGKTPENESWKFKKLSLHRPITNCALEGESPFEPFNNHLAAGEWRILAWLEKMGFEYDIVSGIDLHRNIDLVSKYACIIFSTHCEYWSKQMYEAVRDAHNSNRVWIVNLSGNSLYREVDFFIDGSIRCTSLEFSKSCADESSLIGVRFTGNDYGTAAPYKVIDRKHWVFENAPINPKWNFFGGLSLNQNFQAIPARYDPGCCGDKSGLVGMGASGWETDKVTKTAPKDIKIVAKGLNKWGGADMIVREPKGKRGGLFSASSILFGGALLIDSVTSKIAENVIKRAIEDKNEADLN